MRNKILISTVLCFLIAGLIGPVHFLVPQAGAQFTDPAAVGRSIWKEVLALAYKNALRFMTRTLAYETATWIASGAKGGSPLFYTDSWGDYLKDVGDAALGEFLDTVGKEGFGLNLCEPSFAIRLRLTIGLAYTERPRRPNCTFLQMSQRWDEYITRKDFMPRLQDMFDPYGNELGIALSLHTGMQESINRKVNEAAKTREISEGFKDVTDPISQYIKTPGTMVFGTAKKTWEKASTAEEIYTGTLADTLDVFVNTLLSKLFDRWIKGGMAGSYYKSGKNRSSYASRADYYNQFGDNGGGVAAAREFYASLAEPSFRDPGEYDILAKLTTCPDVQNPGPTDCVLPEKLRFAIENRLTVREAVSQNYLDRNLPFGFLAEGFEPDFRQGYPYRSLLILRHHRIIPVGWELAALYIKNWGTPLNLGEVVAAYDNAASPLYRLVDPDWVLKAPASSCRREGPGPIIASDVVSPGVDANGNGTFTDPGDSLPQRVIRRDTACADEQSCLQENPDGSCKYWGYCTEEQRIWKFGGAACTPSFTSCALMRDRSNTSLAVLKTTVDFNNCNSNNVGCTGYAVQKDAQGKFVFGGERVYLNAKAEACSSSSDGCRAFVKEGTNENVYLKKAPNYLNCYTAGTLPTACSNFAPGCTRDEVGCEKYTPQKGGVGIPAVATANDYCPKACVGYAAFKQVASSFEPSLYPVHFIPTSARTCAAEAVGCDQFTNLDTIARGAESIEHYSFLRRCEKPNANSNTFYTWEGSDTQGFQLRSWSLIAATDGAPACSGSDRECTGANVCTADIFRAGSNPDCREVYDAQGAGARISYRLFSKTIASSPNCISFRKTESTESSCTATGGRWSPPGQAGFCVYTGLPAESRTCSAQAKGCRGYSGAEAGAVLELVNETFETSLGAPLWLGGVLSAESLSQNGHSYKIPALGTIRRELLLEAGRTNPLLTADKSYILSFWAKGGGILKISIEGISDAPFIFGTSVLAPTEWRQVVLGPVALPMPLAPVLLPAAPYRLAFTAQTTEVFVDTVQLRAVANQFYAVQNSWLTPSVCDQNNAGAKVPQAQLGCQAYTDSAGALQYRKSFVRLCREAAVGCTALQDGATRETLVNRPQFTCSAEQVGCMALGKPAYKQDNTVDAARVQNVYLKNDPLRTDIQCGISEEGCEQFTDEQGQNNYFKHPQSRVCELKQTSGQSNPGWYKLGSVSAVPDCPVGDRGVVSASGVVRQPIADSLGNWVGLCSAAQSGCTEFVDPKSTASKNIVFNSSFQADLDANSIPDGWTSVTGWTSSARRITNGGATQNLRLQESSLYVIAAQGQGGTATITVSNCSGISSPDATMTIGSNSASVTGGFSASGSSAAGSKFSGRFSTKATSSCNVSVSVAGGALTSLEVRNAGVYYARGDSVSGALCQGVVNESQGCVVLNRRTVGAHGARPSLIYDVDQSVQGASPVSGPGNDANMLVKVSPDRTCGTWLACKSALQTKDARGQLRNVCLDVGACSSFNERGECDGFPNLDVVNTTLPSSEREALRDISGFSKAGINFGPGKVIEGLLPFSRMEQKGTLVSVQNPSFETFSADGRPASWLPGSYSSLWAPGFFRVIADPIEIQKRGTSVPDGKGFLEVRRSAWAETPLLETFGVGPYIISSYLNTLGLEKGYGYVSVLQFDASRTAVGSAFDATTLPAGLDWQFKVAKITLNPATRFIKLHVGGFFAAPGTTLNEARGSVGFDNVRIEPALQTGTPGSFVPKSCRAFPQDDSMACEYQDASGSRQRGLYGYCIERDPKNPATCITWWPVDMVQGEIVGEVDRSYKGKAPLYYCAESEVWKKKPAGEFLAGRCQRVVNAPRATACAGPEGLWPSCGAFCAPEVIPPGYSCYLSAHGKSGPAECDPGDTCEYRCTATGSPRYTDPAGIAWFVGDTNPLQRFTVSDHEFQEQINGVCTKLVQTVQADGTNFAWLDHVEGGFTVPGLGYTVGYDSSPYGAVTIPATGAPEDPQSWDISSPLVVKEPGGIARAGAPYACTSPTCSAAVKVYSPQIIPYPALANGTTCTFARDRLNRLFAQNYGTWVWSPANEHRYVALSGTGCDWSPPSSLCSPATSRPDYPADYCVVAPSVTNLKVNDTTTGTVVVRGSGFAALKFNSVVNTDQLPMTGYFVDWGDGVTTTVTGAEMQNRPNPDNPHLLYRSLSYWDLKARSQAGASTITCGGSGSDEFCRVTPKVQIRDKWGWCNGRTANEAFYSGTCLTNINAWVVSPVIIEVRKE